MKSTNAQNGLLLRIQVKYERKFGLILHRQIGIMDVIKAIFFN